MTENILETIRKGVQDFVAPEVRQIKADVGALGAKVDALDSKFESKFDAMDSKFESKFDAMNSKFESKPECWQLTRSFIGPIRNCTCMPSCVLRLTS